MKSKEKEEQLVKDLIDLFKRSRCDKKKINNLYPHTVEFTVPDACEMQDNLDDSFFVVDVYRKKFPILNKLYFMSQKLDFNELNSASLIITSLINRLTGNPETNSDIFHVLDSDDMEDLSEFIDAVNTYRVDIPHGYIEGLYITWSITINMVQHVRHFTFELIDIDFYFRNQ